MYHFTFNYGNRLLGNNLFLSDQCYDYAMIFPDYNMNPLTFPDSTKKDTPQPPDSP